MDKILFLVPSSRLVVAVVAVPLVDTLVRMVVVVEVRAEIVMSRVFLLKQADMGIPVVLVPALYSPVVVAVEPAVLE
jgi:hypothetical protein